MSITIIKVCLLHDMGNMVKILEDFSKDEEFLKLMRKFYLTYNDNKNLFASKYQLYLPTEEELAREIEKQKEEFKDKK